MTRRLRGFTLVETIFVCLVLAMLLVLLAYILHGGLRAHAKGELSRKAQSYCRDTLDKMVTELRTALVLPGIPQPASQIPVSAVLWPGPYDDFVPNFGGFYPRFVQPPQNGAPELSVTRNRLIFTRPGSSFTNNSIDMEEKYVYVEYVVPAPGNNNRLLRRVYRVSTGPGAPPGGQESQPANSLDPTRWRAVESYFYPSGANLVPSSIPAANQDVLVLSGTGDSVDFLVSQPRISPPNNQPNVFFEPNLFTITLHVSLHFQSFVSEAQMSNQVNLQARP